MNQLWNEKTSSSSRSYEAQGQNQWLMIFLKATMDRCDSLVQKFLQVICRDIDFSSQRAVRNVGVEPRGEGEDGRQKDTIRGLFQAVLEEGCEPLSVRSGNHLFGHQLNGFIDEFPHISEAKGNKSWSLHGINVNLVYKTQIGETQHATSILQDTLTLIETARESLPYWDCDLSMFKTWY